VEIGGEEALYEAVALLGCVFAGGEAVPVDIQNLAGQRAVEVAQVLLDEYQRHLAGRAQGMADARGQGAQVAFVTDAVGVITPSAVLGMKPAHGCHPAFENGVGEEIAGVDAFQLAAGCRPGDLAHAVDHQAADIGMKVDVAQVDVDQVAVEPVFIDLIVFINDDNLRDVYPLGTV
jgi:hypothetical protein